jgi:hypothetical protein
VTRAQAVGRPSTISAVSAVSAEVFCVTGFGRSQGGEELLGYTDDCMDLGGKTRTVTHDDWINAEAGGGSPSNILGNTALESYERSNCSACHRKSVYDRAGFSDGGAMKTVFTDCMYWHRDSRADGRSLLPR